MSVQESAALVLEQLQILFIFLERPAVQRQIAAVGLILLIAWAVPAGWHYWAGQRRLRGTTRADDRLARVDRFYLIGAPVLALLLIQAVVLLFARHDNSTGMLLESRSLLAVWLVYRLILLLFYARYGPAFRRYHLRIFLPLFLWFLAVRIADNFVNLRLLYDVPLARVFGLDLTIGSLLSAALALYWFFVLAWIAEGVVRKSMTVRKTIEPGVIESAVTITRYVMILLGVLLAMRLLGVSLSTLAIIGGGLSVGIGFGLQNIVANFISGLILLFEQSLLPGDVVELNGRIGTVETVNIRSTTVRTINNVELVVPNENFMINDVTTFTKTDDNLRVLLPFGVSYDSDPHQVRALVSETAKGHPLVLSTIEPDVLFRGFGDSSLTFELAFWINRPETMLRVQSDLYYMIWDALKAHDIEIPYPQRDLNLRRGWDQVIGEQTE